jgi:hypothetical protein
MTNDEDQLLQQTANQNPEPNYQFDVQNDHENNQLVLNVSILQIKQ